MSAHEAYLEKLLTALKNATDCVKAVQRKPGDAGSWGLARTYLALAREIAAAAHRTRPKPEPKPKAKAIAKDPANASAKASAKRRRA